MTYKTVAVVGASGSLGGPIVQALLAAGFKVTAVSRENSSSTFPSEIEVRRANLTSVESLTKAFAGQDVVIITTTTTESGNQLPFVEAAVAAGVKRFIPSEWGYNTRPGKLTGLTAQILSGKTNTVNRLIELNKQHPTLTWTGIATGLFLDWGFNPEHPLFGINLANNTATIFDSGTERAPVSTIPFIAQTVVAVLQRAEQTANQFLDVVEHHITQNQLLQLFEEATGTKFPVTRVAPADLAKARDEKLAAGDPNFFFDEMWHYTFTDGSGVAIPEETLANGQLGVKSKDLGEIVRDYVKARSA